MIKLNLLPPQEKREVELIDFNYLITSLGFWFLFFLMIFSLLLVSTYFSLFIFLKTQSLLIETKQNDEEIQNLIEIEENIKQANEQINKVHLKQKELIIWTPILEELSQIVPRGIYMTGFYYQTNTDQISISGWADRRETLLSFQKSLEESPCFIEVQSPLANLIKQDNINFSFNFLPIK